MTNPVKTLLELLSARSDGQLDSRSVADFFSPESVDRLVKASILRNAESSKTVPCGSCDEEHQIEWKKLPDGKLLAFCERGGGPQFVSRDDIATLRIETKAFLSSLATGLRIESDIRPLVSDELWEIGVITIAKKKRKALFLRTNSLQRHIGLINTISQTTPVTVFSMHAPAAEAIGQVMFIDPAYIASLETDGSWVDTTKLETATTMSGRRVSLGQNGDLALDGRVLCTIPRHSIEFSFVERLMQSYGDAVAHEDIYSYCIEKHGIKSDRTPQRFCNDYRSNIRKLSLRANNKATVEKIIIKARTSGGKNAYKIQNPIEKVAGR
jgi:hypothetical protein